MAWWAVLLWMGQAAGVTAPPAPAAEVFASPDWLRQPSAEEVAGAYPEEARERGLSGHTTISCRVLRSGSLSACTLLSESPLNLGFGQAALSLAPKFQMRPAAINGYAVDLGVVHIPITWQIAPEEEPAAVAVITNPDWARRPSSEDLALVLPQRAMREGRSGSAAITCSVEASGALTGCVIERESAEGYGFGAAALALAPQFRMRPGRVDGQPIAGATVTIPISFDLRGAGGEEVFGSSRFIGRPLWARAPSRAEMAALPGQGVVTLRCAVRNDGRLRGCAVLNESPPRSGLTRHARGLSERFRLASGAEGQPATGGAQVDVRLQFGARPEAYLTAPAWVRAPTAMEIATALTPLAEAAADRTARATVDCAVGGDGRLGGCEVRTASSPEAGAAVAALAERFAVSPWTDDGVSNVGARIRLPLRYVAETTAARGG